MEYVTFRVIRAARKLHLSRFIWMGTSKKMFTDYFKGFEKVEAVRRIFGEKTEEVLKNLRVEFIWFGYMGVDNSDGHLMVNGRYLSSGDKTDIYLDIIHELCHVKQWMDGKELFDPNYDYVDRPTEIEAYRYTIEEAKRIGFNRERILQYLHTEWINEEELIRLIKNMNVNLEETNLRPN